MAWPRTPHPCTPCKAARVTRRDLERDMVPRSGGSVKKKEVLYLLAQDLAGSWALANKVVYISFRTHLL